MKKTPLEKLNLDLCNKYDDYRPLLCWWVDYVILGIFLTLLHSWLLKNLKNSYRQSELTSDYQIPYFVWYILDALLGMIYNSLMPVAGVKTKTSKKIKMPIDDLKLLLCTKYWLFLWIYVDGDKVQINSWQLAICNHIWWLANSVLYNFKNWVWLKTHPDPSSSFSYF